MPIGIDHKDFLKRGTIDEIVYEKCSSLLKNSLIIVSKQKSDVLKMIKKNINNNSSKKIIFGENYIYRKNFDSFTYKDRFGQIELPLPNLLGDFQISNVTSAIVTARHLNKFTVTNDHIIRAITKIKSEGRLQAITKGKLKKFVSINNKIIIDGAHNPLAAFEVKKYLKTLNSKKKIIMILAMMANKDHKKFINIFKNNIHSMVALDIPNQLNFMPKEKLAKIGKSFGIPSKTDISIKSALKNISKKNDNAIIFCTGSLYFAGEILNLN